MLTYVVVVLAVLVVYLLWSLSQLEIRLEYIEAELRRLRSSSVVTGPVTPAQVRIKWDETQKAPAKVRAPRKRKTS